MRPDRRLTKRQKQIVNALTSLGQPSTMHEIAEKAGLHVNGVSQTLSQLTDVFEFVNVTTDPARTRTYKSLALWGLKN